MKRFIVASLAAFLLITLNSPAALADTGTITAGSSRVTFDVQPGMVNGMLMVPVRAVAEALGGTVTWQQESKTARIESGPFTVELTIGKSEARVNDDMVALAAPILLRDSRTLVPVGFLLTLYGHKLTATYDTVKNPRAISLLVQTTQAPTDNIDVRSETRLAVITQPSASPGAAAGREVSVNLESKVEGQLRGGDQLVHSWMSVGTKASPVEVVTARRGSQSWMRLLGVWMNLPANTAAPGTVDLRKGLQELLGPVREAHVAGSLWLAGWRFQDVAVTYDPAAIEPGVRQMLARSLPYGANAKFDFTWEQLDAKVTMDPVSGQTVSITFDAIVTIRITIDGQTTAVHENLHQVTTVMGNTEPIQWPADLPTGH